MTPGKFQTEQQQKMGHRKVKEKGGGEEFKPKDYSKIVFSVHAHAKHFASTGTDGQKS